MISRSQKIFLCIAFLSSTAMANPITGFMLKQKHPAGARFAVVDIANAELQFKRTGQNVFAKTSQGKDIELQITLVMVPAMPCGEKCLVVEWSDPSLNLQELRELLVAPCKTNVYAEKNYRTTQPRGAIQPFGVTKALISCSENQVVRLGERQFKIEVN